ncbi:uncharacterized protein C8Q71DRAFT_858058 [Rhodofomes roseus]|uniref:Uncharacterized protein n=1 Tax=Rhodofomes roseus TaxID=34475 RepID=A0ABQ8KF72_9APHY|nr:uncharacterized protein C8Q71DRAFT_858058 [Rhodofomes roseus]KAH9836040.1 hypothetical protein C8Q71DRAFT_858058 [Rhodofomes roseus]
MFTNPCKKRKTRPVPGYRALKWEHGSYVDVESLDAEKPSSHDKDTEKAGLKQLDLLKYPRQKALTDLIDQFFKKGSDKDCLNGFKKLVINTLRPFINDTQTGERELEGFFVFVRHNAFIRIDYKLWRYNFITDGEIAGNKRNTLCYTFCISLVDHTELRMDELIYLLSEHAGDDGAVREYIMKLINVWLAVSGLMKLETSEAYAVVMVIAEGLKAERQGGCMCPCLQKSQDVPVPDKAGRPLQTLAGTSLWLNGNLSSSSSSSSSSLSVRTQET